MLQEIGANLLVNKIGEEENLTEALTKAENLCENCQTPSPMICVERCNVWQTKHEILEIKKHTSEEKHIRQLFNVLKNERRLKILNIVSDNSRSLTQLQNELRKSGFQHSRITIAENYIKPMIKVGLIRADGLKFKVTYYGQRVQESLRDHGNLGSLPVHSFCNEENVLKKLKTPKTFNELANDVPSNSLSRILMRLRAKGLLAKSPSYPHYVFYHKVEGRTKVRMSPTEKKVFNSIPREGIPVRPLSKVVGINIRQTYKYLHKLREKNLVFVLSAKKTYKLTAQGKEILGMIDDIEKITSSSLNIQVPTIRVL